MVDLHQPLPVFFLTKTLSGYLLKGTLFFFFFCKNGLLWGVTVTIVRRQAKFISFFLRSIWELGIVLGFIGQFCIYKLFVELVFSKMEHIHLLSGEVAVRMLHQ